MQVDRSDGFCSGWSLDVLNALWLRSYISRTLHGGSLLRLIMLFLESTFIHHLPA